jgi:adenine phosphoribosyltransferase
MNIKDTIRSIPDFPKPGILFYDITTLLLNPHAFSQAVDSMVEHFKDKGIEAVAGIESRGFIFGAPLALRLNCPFILIRKPGKLPAETVSAEYSLEYGADSIHMHKDAVAPGRKVLLVDDLLATGGTMDAACRLVTSLDATVAGIAFAIELDFLKGREKLKDFDIFTLVHYDD